jgi:hypothetical protein
VYTRVNNTIHPKAIKRLTLSRAMNTSTFFLFYFEKTKLPLKQNNNNKKTIMKLPLKQNNNNKKTIMKLPLSP